MFKKEKEKEKERKVGPKGYFVNGEEEIPVGVQTPKALYFNMIQRAYQQLQENSNSLYFQDKS